MHTHTQKNKLARFARIGLYSIIIAGAAGASVGTYAWYSYQKTASVSYTATSVCSTGDEMEIGLRSVDGALTAFEATYATEIALGQIEKQTSVSVGGVDDQVIYWIHGNYVQEILADFANAIGSQVSQLPAITAGHYTTGMTTWAGFKRTPLNQDGKRVNSGNAELSDYFYLPLAFRLTGNSDAGSKIFLTGFDTSNVTTVTGYSLKESIRVKVDYPDADDETGNFIFDPNKSVDSSIKVGGALNLNNDIYLDYSGDKEIAYGEFNGAVVYSDDPFEDALDASDSLSIEECDTFTGNHKEGVYVLDDDNAYTCQFKKSAVAAVGTTGAEIAVTNDDGIAFVDFSIYLEGWDKNIVNQTLSHKVSASLEFSIE